MDASSPALGIPALSTPSQENGLLVRTFHLLVVPHPAKGENWSGTLTMAGRSRQERQTDPFRPPKGASLGGNGASVQGTRGHEFVF